MINYKLGEKMKLKKKIMVILSAIVLTGGFEINYNSYQIQAKHKLNVVNPHGVNCKKSKVEKLKNIHWFKKTKTKHLWCRTNVPELRYHINRNGKVEWVKSGSSYIIDYHQYVDLAGTAYYHGKKFYIHGVRHYHGKYKGKKYVFDTPSQFKNNAHTRSDNPYYWPGICLFPVRAFNYARPTVYTLKANAKPIKIYDFLSNNLTPQQHTYYNPFGVPEDINLSYYICPETTFLLRKDYQEIKANDGHTYVPIFPNLSSELMKDSSADDPDQYYGEIDGKNWPQNKTAILKDIKKSAPGSSWQGEWIRKSDLKNCYKGGVFIGNEYDLHLSNKKLYSTYDSKPRPLIRNDYTFVGN